MLGTNHLVSCTGLGPLVPNDRVRALALWEGWFGYGRKTYATMLREAFQPFELFAPDRTLRDHSRSERVNGGYMLQKQVR